MKVILTKDVEDLGNKGAVVNVADGYARNFLVPRSLAVKATDGALRQAEAMRVAREEALIAARQDAEGYAQSLTGTRVVVAARAGDEGDSSGQSAMETSLRRSRSSPESRSIAGLSRSMPPSGRSAFTR